MYQKLTRAGSIGLAVMGLGLGVAAASSTSIETTGPDSSNNVTANTTNRADIDNTNRVSICQPTYNVWDLMVIPEQQICGNFQTATTGDATASHNTTAGDANTGDASNDNSTDSTVNVNNGGMGMSGFFGGSDWNTKLSNTGPDSHNTIDLKSTNTIDVDNHNDINVSNSSSQNSNSGDAYVSHNTNGGNASTGGSNNSNSTSTDVTVSN